MFVPQPLVLFDGTCMLCSKSVQLLLRMDKKDLFKFCTLESTIGQAVCNKYAIAYPTDSFVLIYNDKPYFYEDAVIKIAKLLRGPYAVLAFFAQLVLPCLRKSLYRLVAKYRHSFFSKSQSCLVLTPELKKRFI